MEAEAYLLHEYESIILTMREQISLLKSKLASPSRGRHSSTVVPTAPAQRPVSLETDIVPLKRTSLPGSQPNKDCTIRNSDWRPPATKTVIHDLRARGTTEEILEATGEDSVAAKEESRKGEVSRLQTRIHWLEKENSSLKERVAELEKEKEANVSPEIYELHQLLKDKDKAINHLLGCLTPLTTAAPSKPSLWDEIPTDLSQVISPHCSSILQRVTSARRALSQSSVRRSVGSLQESGSKAEGREEAELLSNIKEELGEARKQVMEIVTRTRQERKDGGRVAAAGRKGGRK